MSPFSVCMSVYKNDKADEVKLAIESILNQTVKPDEVIVVVDGPVSYELNQLLEEFETNNSIKRIIHPRNLGLGTALKTAVNASSNDLIARMDSDDISINDRFEKQLKCFEADPSLSIVGGSIAEFIGTPENIVGIRSCPTEDKDIKLYMKSRCGFNHVTVMFRKSEVLKSGNYQDWHYNEDYYLWLRMMLANCKFKNLEDILVKVRVGSDMYARRGGIKYFKSEAGLQGYMLKNSIISPPLYVYNVLARFIIQVLMPNKIRGFIFRKLFRKQKKGL